MENIDDLEKDMNANAELTRIDKEIEKLTDQWHDVKTDRFLMYFAELGDGQVHRIQVHTSCEDTVAVCAHVLRETIEKAPEELRPMMMTRIMCTIANKLN